MIEDMFVKATNLKSDAGPKLAKLGIKLKLPEPYDGSANIDQFENWLALLVSWLQMYDLDGIDPHIDLMRVQLLCQTLKGRALSFYQTSLEEAREIGDIMSFRGMIIALKERFLHRATALDAAQKFENVTQGSRDTQALIEELRKYAARMVEPPSEYQMKRRFMFAMRKDISSWVISMGHNPETSTLQELMETARNREESQWYQRGFNNAQDTPAHRSTSVDNKGKAPMRYPVKPTGYIKPSQLPQLRKSVPRENTPAPKVGASGNRPQTPGNRTSQQQEKPREKTPGGSQMNTICFLCNKKGHYANSCPEKKGVQGYAIEVVEENDQEEVQELQPGSMEPEEGPTETEPENQENSPEGEQYDPEDHQERFRFSDISEEESVDCRMIHVFPIEELEQNEENMPQLMAVHIPEKVGVAPHNATIRRKVGFVAPQPERDARYQRTISVLLDVGGIKANVLLDTGCTTDAVSPDFARVAGLKPLELTQQVGLSLAVKGSSSKLNYGTWAEVNLGPIRNANTYLDIINIDRYDVILGTPFLWKHGVSPIFEDGGYIQHKGRRLDIPVRVVSRPISRQISNRERKGQSFRTSEKPKF
jgi:hypothetical protein